MSENNRRQDSRYEDIYSDTELMARIQQRRKKAQQERLRTGVFLGVLITLLLGVIGSSVIISLAGRQEPAQETVASAEPSVEESSEESEEESSGLGLENSRQLTVNNKAFSTKVMNELKKDLTSTYIVLYDATNDTILYSKDGTKKCYPASTTKMLTAIVSSRILHKDDVITVGDEIEMIGEESSTAGLVKGMKLTYEAMLDALLLPSGNDAAYTLAVNSARIYAKDPALKNEAAVKLFVELMNEAAKEIGCTGSHFMTPDGWHDDNHYTTARDLALIAACAKTIPLIQNSVRKTYAEWEIIKDEKSEAESSQSSGTSAAESSAPAISSAPAESAAETEESSEEEPFGDVISWYNTNSLLYDDSEHYSPYADGVKTGFTDEAGTSLVASATIKGHTLIASVMFGESIYGKYYDANRLFAEGFKLYGLEYTYG